MKYNKLGNLFDVSALALGGGGIGQVWGVTSQAEAIATVQDAYAAGINFFDMAPLYGQGEAEKVMGLCFANGYPSDIRLTTKCMLGSVSSSEVEKKLVDSLDASCDRLRKDFIDIYILHGYVIPDGWKESRRPDLLKQIAVEYSTYTDAVIPVFEKLIRQGRIGAFGITAASLQSCNFDTISAPVKPGVVQCITNVLDSPGGMAITAETPEPRAVINRAVEENVGVMGIRAVAAGALTDNIDRQVKPNSPEARDFERAEAFRNIAKREGVPVAILAHQYALSMTGVDTVVLGVKNRDELRQCLAAEETSRLGGEMMAELTNSVA